MQRQDPWDYGVPTKLLGEGPGQLRPEGTRQQQPWKEVGRVPGGGMVSTKVPWAGVF